MAYGGLDIGTTSVKFAIYATGGSLLSLAQSTYGNRRQENPNQISGAAVWAAVKRVLAEANAKCPKDDPLRAFAISSFGEAVVPVDRDGNDLAEAFLYTAHEGRKELDQILQKVDAYHLQNITGVRASVIFPPVKINWFRNHTDIYPKVWKFLLFEDYIIHHLTGEALISYSLASRTMALDLDKRKWSSLVLDGAGIDADLLSTPVPSGTFAGRLKKEVARELGMDENVCVYTGGHDQMCGLVGSGAASPRIAANASGTVECLSTVLPDAVPSRGLLDKNIYVSAFLKDRSRFTFVGTPAGCAILDWYRSLLMVNGKEDSIYAILESDCTGKPSPVSVLPYMAGRGAPRRDVIATGSFSGLRLNTTRGDIYQAIMESLAFEMRIIIEMFAQEGIDIDEIHATGGGANSDLWMQLKADIYNRPVVRLKDAQLGALGCAMITAVADGAYSSLQQAVDCCLKKQKTFDPNPENVSLFNEKYAQYKRDWET